MSCFESFHMGAPSEYSIRSKAQIDALFDDSRSMCSSGGLDWQIGPRTMTSMTHSDTCCYSEDGNGDDRSGINGMVQARIEEMFASVDVEETEAEGEEPLPTAAVLQVIYIKFFSEFLRFFFIIFLDIYITILMRKDLPGLSR